MARLVHAGRLVLIVYGEGDVFRFTLRASVQPSYDALQFREFPDHIGDQIAFGELGSTVRARYVRLRNSAAEPLLREPSRQRPHALDFIAITPQAALVGHRRKLGQIVAQRDFLVRVPEKLRVRETCTQNSFVSSADNALRIPRHIHGGEEMWRQFPFAGLKGEVFLMITHHGDEHFLGKSERNAGSKSPMITVGYSFRYVTESRSP